MERGAKGRGGSMLLLNKTLLRMAKGLWRWIFLITGLKLAVLVGLATFARIISGFLGNVASPAMTAGDGARAVVSALLTAVIMLLLELLTGEAQYRCTAKARQTLRGGIFSKVLELDVGNVEKIGPVSAITSSVDGVESMQVYYSQYLPGLFYSLLAPIYLFFQLWKVSLAPAVLLFLVSFLLLPANNVFRRHIETLKTQYWSSMEDLTGYYLESVQGITTFKLFGRDGHRQAVLAEKSRNFNDKIMEVMKVNFSSFLLTDGLIYGAVAVSTCIAAGQLAAGAIPFSSGLMVLLLSFGFFGSVRQLMNATHSALAGVSAADKVEKLLTGAVSLTLAEAAALCRRMGGVPVPAHADADSYSVFSVLGGWPMDVDFELLEVKFPERAETLMAAGLLPADRPVLTSSDAHCIEAVASRMSTLEEGSPLYRLLG